MLILVHFHLLVLGNGHEALSHFPILHIYPQQLSFLLFLNQKKKKIKLSNSVYFSTYLEVLLSILRIFSTHSRLLGVAVRLETETCSAFVFAEEFYLPWLSFPEIYCTRLCPFLLWVRKKKLFLKVLSSFWFLFF